jgi:hypothetical protein
MRQGRLNEEMQEALEALPGWFWEVRGGLGFRGEGGGHRAAVLWRCCAQPFRKHFADHFPDI